MAKKTNGEIHKVMIDGILYLPQTELQIEARKLLHDVYGTLWTNAFYDPYSEEIGEFAKPIAAKMMRLNEILGFRE